MRDILDLLFRIQQRRKIDLLIIGAYALQAHRYSRATNDVDCMTAVTDDAVITEELTQAGFECFEELPSFRRFRHRREHLMVLDVMRVDANTFAKLKSGAIPLDVYGLKLLAPGLSHLIALKMHAARHEHRIDKDTGDIVELLLANPGAVSPLELRQLCDQFGSPELARRLAAFL